MEYFIVRGPSRLKGEITPSGNKNAALPILAATLLTDESVTLENIPRIRDVEAMVELLKSVGSDVRWKDENTVIVQTHLPKEKKIRLNKEYACDIRASILFAGPLLARGKSVYFPPPGGDIIGRRRLDTHFYALRSLGAEIHTDKKGFLVEALPLVGTTVFLDEPSVTATENAIIASTRADGEMVIRNAASEPHVRHLIGFLNHIGSDIDGVGSNVLTVRSKGELGRWTWKIASWRLPKATPSCAISFPSSRPGTRWPKALIRLIEVWKRTRRSVVNHQSSKKVSGTDSRKQPFGFEKGVRYR